MEIFTYTISTTGNPCAPETSLSGVIQVNPLHQLTVTLF